MIASSREWSDRRDKVVAAQYEMESEAASYADQYQSNESSTRYFRSRLHLVTTTLASHPGGDLLDVGCGPGMMVRELVESRPGHFRITALDRSPAMVRECSRRNKGAKNVTAVVGRVEKLPFSDCSLDVVLAMGVLEYVEVRVALEEIKRVLRPGGLLVATMLNPTSPYRIVEWHVYWPLVRSLGRVERWLGVPPEKRHDRADTGIRAYREEALRESLAAAGLMPTDSVYYDVTLLVPPIDRIARRLSRRRWHDHPERSISRGWLKGLGTAYMIVAAAPVLPTLVGELGPLLQT